MINGYIEIELAFSGLDLGDVDVEIADRIRLELFLRRFATLDFRQSDDALRTRSGCLIGSATREEVPRDGIPCETLSKAFVLLVLACLGLVFLYSIFGLNP